MFLHLLNTHRPLFLSPRLFRPLSLKTELRTPSIKGCVVLSVIIQCFVCYKVPAGSEVWEIRSCWRAESANPNGKFLNCGRRVCSALQYCTLNILWVWTALCPVYWETTLCWGGALDRKLSHVRPITSCSQSFCRSLHSPWKFAWHDLRWHWNRKKVGWCVIYSPQWKNWSGALDESIIVWDLS